MQSPLSGASFTASILSSPTRAPSLDVQQIDARELEEIHAQKASVQSLLRRIESKERELRAGARDGVSEEHRRQVKHRIAVLAARADELVHQERLCRSQLIKCRIVIDRLNTQSVGALVRSSPVSMPLLDTPNSVPSPLVYRGRSP